MIKVTDINTGVSQTFATKLEAAEMIAELNITKNSVNTLVQKLGKALSTNELLYEALQIEEVDVAQETDPLETVENVAGKTDDEKKVVKDEEKTKRRTNGKQVEWFLNGELKQVFPSIKAATKFFKETLELKAMPFTPIMKSIREGKDWNENSYKFTQVEESKTEEKAEDQGA